jgi:hypothetical protein
MSEATPVNVTAFQPFEGGNGKRLAVSTTSTRVAIPGTQAVATPDRLRILVSNNNSFAVSILMGQDSVTATLDNQQVLPGTQVLFTPPVVAPDAVWIAVICESGTGYIQVTAGYGT